MSNVATCTEAGSVPGDVVWIGTCGVVNVGTTTGSVQGIVQSRGFYSYTEDLIKFNV